MRIGIIGGVERGWSNYEELARAEGFSVELHSGHVRGRGGESLESLVQRSDLVVIVTEINSQAGVQQARKLVRRHGRRQLLVRNFGVSRFAALLAALRIERRGRAASAG